MPARTFTVTESGRGWGEAVPARIVGVTNPRSTTMSNDAAGIHCHRASACNGMAARIRKAPDAVFGRHPEKPPAGRLE